MAGYKNASPRRRCMGVRGKKKEEKKKHQARVNPEPRAKKTGKKGERREAARARKTYLNKFQFAHTQHP